MADQHEKPDESPGAAKTPVSSKLDNLSRDDLMKFVKRQIAMLQKLKARNDELTNKVKELETNKDDVDTNKHVEETGEEDELANTPVNTQVREWNDILNDAEESVKLQALNEEKEEILLNYQATQQTLTEIQEKCHSLEAESCTLKQDREKVETESRTLQGQNKELQEQVECMNMKDETMTTTFQFLQTENDQLRKEKTDLDEQNGLLTEARDQLMEKIQGLKHSYSELVTSSEVKVQELTNQNHSLQESTRHLEDKLNAGKNRIKSMENEVDAYMTDIDSMRVVSQKHEETNRLLEDENTRLTSELEKLKETISIDIQALNHKCEESTDRIKELEQTKENMQKSFDEEKSHLISQMNTLVESNEEFQKRCKDLEASLEEVKSCESGSKVNLTENLQGESTTSVNDMKAIKCSFEAEMEKNSVLQSVLIEAQNQVKDLGSHERDLELAFAKVQQKCEELESSEAAQIIAAREAKMQGVIKMLKNETERKDEIIRLSVEDKENMVYEINELKEEKEMARMELQTIQQKMNEWDDLMDMLKKDKDHVVAELDDADQREKSFRQEMDFLMASLSEALSERDDLQDEVFKMNENDGSFVDEVHEMTQKVQELIAEKTKIEKELTAVKGDTVVEIQSLKNRLGSVYDEKDHVEREKESVHVLHQLMQDKVDSLEEEISNLNMEMVKLEDLRQYNEQIVNEKDECVKKIQTLSEGGEELQNTLEEREKYVKELETKMLTMSEKLSKSKAMYADLKSKIETEETSLSQVHEQEIQDLRNELDETINEKLRLMDILNKEIAKYNVDIETLTSEIDKIKLEMGNAKTDLNAENKKLEDEIQTLTEKLTSMSLEKEKIEMNIQEMKQRLEDQENEKRNFDDEVNNVKDKLSDTILTQNEQLSAEIASLTSAADATSLEMDSIKSENQRLNDSSVSITDEVNSKSEENDALKSEINIVKGKFENLEHENASALNSIKNLNIEICSLTDLLNSMSLEKEKLEMNIQEIKQKLEDQENEKRNFDDEVNNVKDKLSDTILTQNEQLSAEIDSLTSAADARSLEMDSIKSENQRLNDSIVSITDEVNSKSGENDSLKSEVNNFENLEHENASALNEIKNLNSKICDLEGHNHKLNEAVDWLTASLDNANVNTNTETVKLKQEIAIVTEHVNAMSVEKDNLQTELDHAKRTMEDVDKEKVCYISEIDKLHTRCSDLEIQVSQQSEESEQLKQANQSLSETLKGIENDSESYCRELETVKVTNVQLLSSSEDKIQSLEHIKESAKSASEETKTLDTELNLLKIELQTIAQERNTLNTNMDIVTHERAGLKESINHLEMEIKKLQAANSKLKQEINNTHETVNTLEETVEQLTEEKMVSVKEIETLSLEHEQQSERFQQMQNNLDICVKEKVSIESKCNDAIKVIENLRLELAETTDNNKTISLENSQLRTNLEKSVKNINSLKVQLDEVTNDKHAQISNLSSQIEQLTENISEQEMVINELKQDKNNNSESMKKLEHSISELKEAEIKFQEISIHASEYEHELLQKCEELKHVSDGVESELKARLRELELKYKLETEAAIGKEQQLVTRCEELETNSRESLLDKTKKEEEKLQKSEASNAEIEKLKHTLKERDAMCSKLKTVAVKAKKDLAELKKSYSSQTDELQHVQASSVRLQQQLDRLANDQDSAQAAKTQELTERCDSLSTELKETETLRGTYKSDFETTLQQLTDLKTTVADLKSQKDELLGQKEALSSQVKSHDAKLKEMRKLEQECEANRIQKDELVKEKQQLQTKFKTAEDKYKDEIKSMEDRQKVEMQTTADRQTEVEDKHKSVVEGLQNQLQDMQKTVENAKQEASQSSMMDLEIADYDRTVQALNGQITEKDKQIEEQQTEVERLEERTKTLQEQIEMVEEQRVQAEDRGNKLKQLLVKAKKDITDAKKWETEQRSSDAQMKGQIERFQQQMEEYKMQIAMVTADKQKLDDRLRTTGESSQKTVKLMESRIASLQDDLELARTELATVQTDYEGYKIRVSSVLRQQKTRGPSETHNDGEKLERERLERVVEQLKSKLDDTNENYTSSLNENEALQDSHDRLLQRHTKSLQEYKEKEDAYRKRLEDISREKTMAVSEQIQTIRQLSVQNETLTHSFKDQMKSIQDDHRKSMDLVHNQLESVENENTRLQRDLQQLQQKIISTPKSYEKERSLTPTPVVEFIPDFRHIERQEGEGSEIVDVDPCPRVAKPAAGLMPFDQLLTTDIDDTMSVTSTHELEITQEKLLVAQRRNDHLNELMNESEVTVMRLTEQSVVLKEEIRRLERNMQRERETQNMEYLKNILMKFLSLSAGDERSQLIPVLNTMLKLSTEEKSLLQAIALGEDGGEAQQQASGWGTYLHRWSGLT